MRILKYPLAKQPWCLFLAIRREQYETRRTIFAANAYTDLIHNGTGYGRVTSCIYLNIWVLQVGIQRRYPKNGLLVIGVAIPAF